MQQLIIKSLLCVQKVIINDKHCFELYGFDILLDSALKPWLLEINASPSMTANTPHDSELKINLLDDVITIIDVEKVLTGLEEQIGGFDLIYKGAPVKLPINSMFSSLLGAFNNRSQQLKKLAKNSAIHLQQNYQENLNNNTIIVNNSTKTTNNGGILAINAENLQKKTIISKGSINKKNSVSNMNKPASKIMGGTGQNNVKKVLKNTKIPAKIQGNQMKSLNNGVKNSAFHQSVINNLNNMKKNGGKSELEIKYEEAKRDSRSIGRTMGYQKKTSVGDLKKNNEENEE